LNDSTSKRSGLAGDLQAVRRLPPLSHWRTVDPQYAWIYGDSLGTGDFDFKSEFGFDFGAPGQQAISAGSRISRRLSALRKWSNRVRDHIRGECIFVDNTTIYSYRTLTSEAFSGDGFIAAISLMDLDTIIRSLVLCERVFHLANQSIKDSSINAELGDDVLVPIPIEAKAHASVDSIVWSLGDEWDRCAHDLWWYANWPRESGPAADGAAMKRAWETLLGSAIGWDAVQGDRPSVDRDQWSSWPPNNVARMAAVQHGLRYWRFLNSSDLGFIYESNLRALFNSRIADALELAYAPSISRVPFNLHRLNNAVIAHDAFLDVAEIQNAVISRTKAAERSYTVRVPVLLSVVLSRMKRRKDFWPLVANLRNDARRYRAGRHDIREALAAGDERAYRRLRKSIGKETATWSEGLASTALTTAAVSVPLLSIGHGEAALAVAILRALMAARDLKMDAVSALVSRITRNEDWFVTRVGDSAAAITNALPRIQSLWALPDSEAGQCADALKRLANVDAMAPALK
jgi:hypothetical protein